MSRKGDQLGALQESRPPALEHDVVVSARGMLTPQKSFFGDTTKKYRYFQQFNDKMMLCHLC